MNRGGRRALILPAFIAGGLLVTLLGFGIRAHHLGGDSFWIDEIATVETARTLAGAIGAERDHPPLVYLLTHLSLRLLGESEFTARLPALFAGTLAFPLLALLGKQLRRPNAGLWAAFLLALAPFHLRHAQEARHYAWLLLFTMAGYLLLLRVLEKPTRRSRLLFAVVTTLNLYTHFAALLVLATQVILAGIWLCLGWTTRSFSRAAFSLGAAGLALIFFAPWLVRLRQALPHNLGADILTDTGSAAGLFSWWRNILLASAGGGDVPALLLIVLCVAGLFIPLFQRDSRTAALLWSTLLFPPLLIPLLGIARGAFPRYLIFLLPFFFLANGIALDVVVRVARRRRGRRTSVTLTGVAGLTILLLSLPRLQGEYSFMVGDWRGITEEMAAAGSQQPVVALSLHSPTGYNIAAASLPYYLGHRPLLAGNQLQVAEARSLGDAGEIWYVVHDWNPGSPLTDLPGEQTAFQTALYLTRRSGDLLSETIALYEALLPRADTPIPQCLLRQDLAALYAADLNLETAVEHFLAATRQCPDLPSTAAESARQRVRQSIIDELAHTLTQSRGGEAGAFRPANLLLMLQPDHPVGLQALTVVDLGEMFASGAGIVQQESLDEPVRLAPFIMPGGDPAQVLFLHPPASLSYSLTLPAEPVDLYFRAALAPESWEWGGDGATFIVTLQPASGANVELFRRHISNDPAERTWHPGRISLAAYAGQPVTLMLRTESGPAGDFTGDWAGWENLRLLRRFDETTGP